MFESLNPFNWFSNLFTQNEPEQDNTHPLISLIENKLSEINILKQKIHTERFDLAQLYSLWLRKKDLNQSPKELYEYFVNHEKEYDVPEPLYTEIIQYIHDNDGDFKNHIEQLFRNNIEKNNHELEIFNFQSLIYNLILKVINQKIEATKLISILNKYLEKHPILASKKDIFLEYIAEFVEEIHKNKNNTSAFENLFSKPDNFFQNNPAIETQSNDDGEIYNYSSFIQTAYNVGKNAFANFYKGINYALEHPINSFVGLSSLFPTSLVSAQSSSHSESIILGVSLIQTTYLDINTSVAMGYTTNYGAQNLDVFIGIFSNNILNNAFLIGGSNYDLSLGIASEPEDNSFYVSAVTRSYSGNDDDFYIANYFRNGTRKWGTIIGGPGDDLPTAITILDTQVCFTGYTNTPSGRGNDMDVSLVCLNKYNGTFNFWKTYTSAGHYHDQGLSIRTTLNKKFIIGGQTLGATGGGFYYDRLFLKIDPNATSTLENVVTSGTSNYDDIVNDIFVTANETIYSTSYTQYGSTPPNLLTSVYSFIDGTQQTQITSKSSSSNLSVFSDIAPIYTLNNSIFDFFVTGTINNTAFLTKFPLDLNNSETNLFSANSFSFSITYNEINGDYILLGNKDAYTTQNNNSVSYTASSNLNTSTTNCTQSTNDLTFADATSTFPFNTFSVTESNITPTKLNQTATSITTTPISITAINKVQCQPPTPSPTPAPPTPFPTPPVSQTPPNTQPPTSQAITNSGGKSSSSNGMNVGAIVGSIIGIIVIFGAVLTGIFLYWRSRKSKPQENLEFSENQNHTIATNATSSKTSTGMIYDALPKVTQDPATNTTVETSTYNSIPKVTQQLSIELKDTATNSYAAVSAVTQQTQAIPHIYDNSPNSTITTESTTSSANNNVYVDWRSSQKLPQPVTSPSNVYNNVPPDFNSANSTPDANDSKKRKSQYNALNPENLSSTSNSSFWSASQTQVSDAAKNASDFNPGNRM